MTTIVATAAPETEIQQPGRLVMVLRYLRRNKGLAIGLAILLALVLFTVIGLITVNPKQAYPLSVATKKPPSLQYPFGTDFFGRNLLSAIVATRHYTLHLEPSIAAASAAMDRGAVGAIVQIPPRFATARRVQLLDLLVDLVGVELVLDVVVDDQGGTGVVPDDVELPAFERRAHQGGA